MNFYATAFHWRKEALAGIKQKEITENYGRDKAAAVKEPLLSNRMILGGRN